MLMLSVLLHLAASRLVEVRCLRPDGTESKKTFEHQHLNNPSMIVASAGLAPATHNIAFVETTVGETSVGLGDGGTMAQV